MSALPRLKGARFMVSSTREAIACILLIFASGFYADSQTSPAAKVATASISGRVTIKGKGAAGIVVALRLESSHQQTSRYKTVTDDQGNYKICNVPPGQYQVLAAASAFVASDESSGPKTVIINKDEAVENIDIALVRGGVITGKVTDADGRPLIEEEVFCHPAQVINRYAYIPTLTRTDDRGIYRIFGLVPGKYRVAAGQSDDRYFGGRGERGWFKLTYHPAATDISQASIIEVTEGGEATNVDITLGRALHKYSARGRIVDGKTGQPLPSVRYGVQFFFEAGGGSTTSGAVTSSQGEFKLENLSPGKYAVFAEPPPGSDWRVEPVPFEVIDQDVTGLIVKTSKGASVSGMVVLEGTEDKAVLANLRKIRVHADIMGEDFPTGDSQSSNVDLDGSFQMGALKAGTLMFSLSNHGRFQIVRLERGGIVYPKGIEIKDGEHLSGVRLVLNYGNGAVRGVIKIEGGTLPQNGLVFVTLKKIGDDSDLFMSRFGQSARVDTRGQFLIEGLLPGTYEVIANIFVPPSRVLTTPTRQQIVVTNDNVTSVTLNVNVNSTVDRP